MGEHTEKDCLIIVPKVGIEIITWWKTKAKFRFKKRENFLKNCTPMKKKSWQ